MTRYELSPLARQDLWKIRHYTARKWGIEQTIRYMKALEMCLDQLAKAPQMGRPSPNIRPGSRRFEHQKHVIFYRETSDGIRVLRVLHERQLPRLHMI